MPARLLSASSLPNRDLRAIGVACLVALATASCAYFGGAPTITSTAGLQSPSQPTAAYAASAEDACMTALPTVTEWGLPYDKRATVSAAFEADLGAFEDALDKQAGVSKQPGGQSRPIAAADSTVTVCYFDGDFGPARGDTAGEVGDYSRVVFAIAGDKLMPVVFGFKESLPILPTGNAN